MVNAYDADDIAELDAALDAAAIAGMSYDDLDAAVLNIEQMIDAGADDMDRLRAVYARVYAAREAILAAN